MCMSLRRGISRRVAINVFSGTTEDRVRAVRTQIRGDQPEHVGTAADDVILSLVAINQVVAAVPFNIIISVRVPVRNRMSHSQHINRGGTISLNNVITQLSKDHIVIRTTGDRIIAPHIQVVFGDISVVQQHDGPSDKSIRVNLPVVRHCGHKAGHKVTGRRIKHIQRGSTQHPHVLA